ncbi:hypothetical protein F4678DRAFT_463692 [Xylaria arbuscula]|nr:hypothetical protein F4678DRAFT_463692 [Xylaria arbuscula]
MASQDEPQVLDGVKDSDQTEERYSENFGKHRKARPSVDIQLAQNYKERQGLPPIRQGVDPELPGSQEEDLDADMGYVKIALDEHLKIDLQKRQSRSHDQGTDTEDERLSRDSVTGRMLSTRGTSCLGCAEKGLRCTLNFFGKENESQCAACRRSKAPQCVRFYPLGESSRGVPYHGPPWKNPNFVAGGPADKNVSRLPSEKLEEILRDFYEGQSQYVQGNYLAASDARNFALPPFNGVDLPSADRPKNYEGMDWRDVLPDWKNRSLRPLRMADERERQKKKLSAAREMSLLPPNPGGEEAVEVTRKKMARLQMRSAGDTHEDDISFLRVLRRYPPRERNLSDVA